MQCKHTTNSVSNVYMLSCLSLLWRWPRCPDSIQDYSALRYGQIKGFVWRLSVRPSARRSNLTTPLPLLILFSSPLLSVWTSCPVLCLGNGTPCSSSLCAHLTLACVVHLLYMYVYFITCYWDQWSIDPWLERNAHHQGCVSIVKWFILTLIPKECSVLGLGTKWECFLCFRLY